MKLPPSKATPKEDLFDCPPIALASTKNDLSETDTVPSEWREGDTYTYHSSRRYSREYSPDCNWRMSRRPRRRSNSRTRYYSPEYSRNYRKYHRSNKY